MTSWHDIAMRGRRLEKVSRLCETEIYKNYARGDVDSIELMFSYFDRLLKTEQAIKPYIEEYLGVKKLIKEANQITV